MQWGRVIARVGIVVGVAVALTACGGDEESSATSTPTSTVRASVTATRTSTPTATATMIATPPAETPAATPEPTQPLTVQPTQAPIVQPIATLPPPPPPPPPVVTEAPPPPPVVTEAPPPPPPPPVQAAVSLSGLAFSPASVSVTAGSTVVWTNNDSFPHDVKADGGEFGSATLNNGDSYSAQFGSAGTFSYFCSIHPFMRGSVVVN